MAFAVLAVCFVANAAVDKTAELEYLGNPADDRWGPVNRGFEHAALDLEVFHDRVFVGTGNWDANSGPCYIPAFDTTTGAYRNEYLAGTEAIETIRTFDDDTLCAPATDHCEGGAYGYVNCDWFSRTADGAWSGGSASPSVGLVNLDAKTNVMTHNWDMAKFGDWIFCGGYGVAGSNAGGIWSSVADDPGNSLRVTSFIRCGDELFCRSASCSVYFTSGKPNDAKAGYQPKLWHWNKTSERFEQVASSWADLMPEVRQSDFALTYANPATYANHHAGTWHATPFKSRNLYIVGTVGYSVNFGKDLGGQIAPRGVFPAFAVSGYAENGVLKGDRITLPSGTYPYDFAVSGNAAYMLTFRYKSETQMVEHGVWKTTDGVSFTELFTFDYHEVMMSVEYHKGWFYFGVSHKKSQPLIGTLASGTEEMAGSIYRVRCPQEPVQVVASAPSVTVSEGGSQSVAFSLSAAPASNLTLRVVCAADNTRFSVSPATLSFTTSDWATPKSVTVSLADDAVVNREVTGRLVCGADGADPKRGLLAGDEVTAATVVLTPGDDENVAPANGEIRTADDFYCAMCRPDGDYRLMNDLDLSAAGFETIPLWSGSFDGQGHAITGLAVPICRISSGSFSNLTLDGEGATIHVIRRGVFCETVRGGAFTNCTVRGWSVRTAAGSRNDVGLFAAVAEEGSVFSGCTTAADCEVGQEAQQVDINLGGFVGKVTAANSTVYGTVAVFDGCTNNAAISGVGCNNTSYGRGGFVGAIVGFSSAATPYPEVDFVRSANFGAVTSTGKMENLGGFVGKVDGAGNNKTCVLARFEGCDNFGVVTSSGAGNSCGGIVGLVNACANAVLDGCTNNAAIGSETVTQSGGLVGCFANASKLDVGGMAIDDCANLADVTANTYAGGLVGTASSNGGWGTGKFQFFDSMNTGAVSAVSTTNAEIIANCSFSSTSATTTLVVSNCVTVTGNLCVSCSKTPVANDNRLLSELPPEEPDTPPEQPEAPQDLTAQLEFVGNPTLERWLTRGTANSILDIEVNDDRLFFACGEWSGNSGPVFMKSFDPYFCTYTNEYAAGTEGVEVLRTFSDGGLYFPAIDHMDKGSYDNGYWFKRAKGGEWSAGFANGTSKNLYTHVYDMQQFGDWMFLYSGCPVGSKDGGANWLRLDGLDSNKQNGSLLRCGDEFFCVEAYPMDFGTGTNPNATPLSDQYTRHGPTVWHWNATTEKFTGTVEPTWDNLAPEIVLSDCDLVTTNASIVGRPGRFWHTTPFRNRCLYVIGDEYSDRTYTVNGKSVTLKPIGTRPEIAVSAYAENGALKGTRIHLPAKTWPIDFTVAGDTAYMLAFSYVPDTQMVRHGVWKSTDGVSFTEILTVDYPQVMQAFDYHMGYFYFGVAHQNAEPNLGPIKSGTKESAGDIYRVYCPQEPVTAVASVSTLPVSEGGSSVINYTLSAQPVADVTLAVRLLGGAGLTLSTESIVFTRANWNSPHPVTVTYPQNDRRDAESVVLVCGIETPTSLRGRFDSPEVTASIVSVELTDDDRAPTISAEAFDNAKIPFTYTATLADLGSLNGQAAGSATVTLTAYDDDACTHAVDSDSKTVTTTGEVSLTLTNLVRGAWYTFVAEAKSSEESAVRSSMRLRAPIGTAAQLVDLTDDLSNRAGTYATNAAIGPSGNSGAWDNDLTKYFGGYKDPREAIYEFNTPMVVNGFGLRGMGNPASDEQDRHPSGYSLYGTADTNGTWTLLAQVTGDPIWSPSGEWRRIYAPNTTAYKYYKLTLDSAQMPSMPRIAAAEVELYFIGEPDTPPEEPEEPVGLNNLGAPEGDRFDLSLQQTWPAADYGAEVCLWRYDRYAALSFGHDDNCDWDIPFLLRESERNGFKLTWWLITKNIGDSGSTSGSGNWPEWRECFAAGHAIESHSHTHEWAGGGQTVQAAAAAAGMSVEDYVEFCMYSNSLAVIREKIPGCKPSTLAFPGGESYPEIANRYFVSGRSVGPYINRANAINYQSVNASSSGINPGTVNVLLGGRGGSKALTGWMASFNDAKNYRGWFVPFLHTESTHDGLPNAGHEQGVTEQIQRFELLGRHRRHLWLGTYPAIAKYGQSRDTATLTVVKKTASEITFTLVDQMRNDWYDEPLTVKVRLPAAWAQSGVAATQGGNALDAFYIEREGAKYALVNAVPDRGTVTLVPAAANSGAWDETSYEAPTYTYQVRFFDTDGTTLLKTIIAHPIDTSAAEFAPVLYKPGYKLSWTTEDGVALDNITDDVDFKAVWTATDEKPKAVFVDDSTGEELTFVEAVYGDRPAQPADLPAREGYIAYWEPDLGPIVSNTQFRVKYMRDDDPIPGAIIVRTAEEFCDAMANHPDAVIRMVRDIDISGYGYTAVPEFSGTFKAYGHILTGLGDTSLCVTNSGAFVGLKVLGDSDAEHPVLASGYGVFAVVSDAGVFTDCRVDGYAIRANAQYLAYGVFVGTALKGTAFMNCTVGATCSIDQGSKPNNEIGGFVGLLSVTDPLGTLITFAHCTNEAPIYATGDYNEAHGDGGFIGRASGCGAASTPEILFVDCAELGLVSSSGGKSNLGGYIGYVPGLKVNSTCKVIFEGCTTTMPVGASANAVGEWIGLASNVVIEQKEYIPPEEPDNPPVGPDDPPVEPEKPTEFVTNDWFDVEFEDDGYKDGSDWTKTSTDKSGGTWSGDDGEATTLDGTTFVVTLTDTFEGELRYTPSKASEADADVVVEGTMEVSAAAREIRPEDVPFALTFESKQSGSLTPVAYIGGAWHSFGTTGFAADAWVDWKVEVDQASTNAPRIKVTIAQKGGAVETSGWIAGGFAAKQVSALSYIGVGSFGDFKARYLTVKGGEVIELVPPEFAADGSALGFKFGIGETRMFTLKITNPVKGAYYTVLTSTTLEGPFLPEGGSVLFDQDSGTLTLEVSADTPQKFAKIIVSVSPID